MDLDLDRGDLESSAGERYNEQKGDLEGVGDLEQLLDGLREPEADIDLLCEELEDRDWDLDLETDFDLDFYFLFSFTERLTTFITIFLFHDTSSLHLLRNSACPCPCFSCLVFLSFSLSLSLSLWPLDLFLKEGESLLFSLISFSLEGFVLEVEDYGAAKDAAGGFDLNAFDTVGCWEVQMINKAVNSSFLTSCKVEKQTVDKFDSTTFFL